MKKFLTSPMGIIVIGIIVYLIFLYVRHQSEIKSAARAIAGNPSNMASIARQANDEGRPLADVLADRVKNVVTNLN